MAGTHPDILLPIWKKPAEGQINLVKTKTYEEAAGSLDLLEDGSCITTATRK